MLILYNKNENNFRTLGLGILKDYLSDPIITEEINSSYTLEFEYSKDGYLSESLIEENIIKAKGQLFRIWQVKKDMRTIKILAKHIFFDLSKNFLVDVAPTNLTAQDALTWILSRTSSPNNFKVFGDCTELSSARYVRKTVTDAIFNADNSLLKRFGGELEYDNFKIFVHARRGYDSNFSIRYRKNLKGIDFNLDFSTVVTRIVPLGNDELMLDELYVDSPKINDYFQPLYAKIEFDVGVDDKNGVTLEMAKQQLIEEANKLYNNGIDLPEISIKVDFIELSKCEEYKQYSNLERCELGDTIKTIIPELNINCNVRVVKTIYNCNLERYTNLELGTVKPDFANTQSKLIDSVNNAINNINPKSILSQAQENAESLINHPFAGNILIDYDNGNLYLMDTTNPETAQNIWKWSLGGLGFSNTGINGTYLTAITQDGSINANFITTGKINTDLIEGYNSLILKVENTETKINGIDDYKLTNDTTFQDNKNYYRYDENKDEYVLLIKDVDYVINDPINENIYEYNYAEGLEQKINSVETKQTATDFTINIISKNINKTNGNIERVETINSYLLDENGLKIGTTENDFNALHNNVGTYYKDGDTVLSQTTKDGTITRDLVLYGKYYYGVDEDLDVANFKKDDAMFVAEKYINADEEEGFGHFYNGGE